MTSPATPDVQEMHMVHTMFRREFGALPALVRDVAVGDVERAHLIAEHIVFLAAVLEAHHHSEDTHLWPALLDRVSEEVAPVVHLMEDHHERIEQLTDQILTALEEWCQDANAERGRQLADVLGGFLELLDKHMGLEEQRILPLAEQYVTAAEWHAMGSASGAALPPGRMALVFGMTMYEADPGVMEKTLSALPPEVRTMLEDQGPREFAAHSARVHGTPAPRRSSPLQPAQS